MSCDVFSTNISHLAERVYCDNIWITSKRGKNQDVQTNSVADVFRVCVGFFFFFFSLSFTYDVIRASIL